MTTMTVSPRHGESFGLIGPKLIELWLSSYLPTYLPTVGGSYLSGGCPLRGTS
jgi:hypothetical protein